MIIRPVLCVHGNAEWKCRRPAHSTGLRYTIAFPKGFHTTSTATGLMKMAGRVVPSCPAWKTPTTARWGHRALPWQNTLS